MLPSTNQSRKLAAALEMDERSQDNTSVSPKDNDSERTRSQGIRKSENTSDTIDIKCSKNLLIIILSIILCLVLISTVILGVLYANTTNNNSSNSSSDELTSSTTTHLFNNSNNNASACSSDSSSINAAVSFGFETDADNKLKIYNLPDQILPGIQFFAYSYNLLQGKPPMDLIILGRYHQIISLSFDENKVSTGSEAYLVPDQIDLPGITSVCESQTRTTSVSSATSASSMYHIAKAGTNSESLSASVSASGWGFSASASYSMSLSHSQSSSMQNARSQSKEGKSESSHTYSRAKLYGTTVRWDDDQLFLQSLNGYNPYNSSASSHNSKYGFVGSFIKAVYQLEMSLNSSNINTSSSNILLLNFIVDWGSHVLKQGTLGAECRESTYFESSYSSQSLERSNEAAQSSDDHYSGSVSGGGDYDGFSGSFSASYEHASSSSIETNAENSNEASYSSEYSTETTYCIGEIYISSSCGQMLGRTNEPSLVTYEMQPIWDLNIFSESTKIQFGIFFFSFCFCCIYCICCVLFLHVCIDLKVLLIILQIVIAQNIVEILQYLLLTINFGVIIIKNGME